LFWHEKQLSPRRFAHVIKDIIKCKANGQLLATWINITRHKIALLWHKQQLYHARLSYNIVMTGRRHESFCSFVPGEFRLFRIWHARELPILVVEQISWSEWRTILGWKTPLSGALKEEKKLAVRKHNALYNRYYFHGIREYTYYLMMFCHHWATTYWSIWRLQCLKMQQI
jgi:hypothetical protein